MVDLLDMIIDPSKTPKITTEGRWWAVGSYDLDDNPSFTEMKKADRVHIAVHIHMDQVEKTTKNWVQAAEDGEDMWGYSQYPTDRFFPLRQASQVGFHRYFGTSSVVTICPTHYVSNAITPEFPGFAQVMQGSEWELHRIPHIKNLICTRCFKAYRAISTKPNSARSVQLIRGIGMRMLKQL